MSIPDHGEDKYSLQGWNNDAQENEGAHNLLKILEKKITFPLLQGTLNCQQKKRNKEEPMQSILKQHTKDTFGENHIKSSAKELSKEHKQPNNQYNFSIKRNKTEKIRPLICREGKAKTQENQQSSKKPAWPINQSCLDFFKEEPTVHKQKGRKEILAKKHKRIQSLTSLPTKSKLAILEERVIKIPLYYPNSEDRKSKLYPIKTEDSKITDSKLIFLKNWESKTKHLLMRERQSSLKAKKRKPEEDIELKTTCIKKMMQKSSIWNKSILRAKVLKTEVNDFMDEHLQSPCCLKQHLIV